MEASAQGEADMATLPRPGCWDTESRNTGPPRQAWEGADTPSSDPPPLLREDVLLSEATWLVVLGSSCPRKPTHVLTQPPFHL